VFNKLQIKPSEELIIRFKISPKETEIPREEARTCATVLFLKMLIH